jgi:hypothetical protein
VQPLFVGTEVRFDPDTGTYVFGEPAPVAQPIEPAFIRESVTSEFDPEASNVEVRAPRGVTTFPDVYPRGTKDHAVTDAPSDEDFDPLDDWRIAGDVADDILISLPDGTPRMVRTMLTLLLGAMRRGGSRHS